MLLGRWGPGRDTHSYAGGQAHGQKSLVAGSGTWSFPNYGFLRTAFLYTVLTARWTGGLASRRSIRNCLCSFSRAISPLLRGGSGHSAVCPHNAQKLTHTRQQNQKNILYVVSLTVCSTAAVIYLGAQRANKGWARLKRKYGHSMG